MLVAIALCYCVFFAFTAYAMEVSDQLKMAMGPAKTLYTYATQKVTSCLIREQMSAIDTDRITHLPLEMRKDLVLSLITRAPGLFFANRKQYNAQLPEDMSGLCRLKTSPDNKYGLFWEDDVIHMIDLSTGQNVWKFKGPGSQHSVPSVALNPTNTWLALATRAGSVFLYERTKVAPTYKVINNLGTTIKKLAFTAPDKLVITKRIGTTTRRDIVFNVKNDPLFYNCETYTVPAVRSSCRGNSFTLKRIDKFTVSFIRDTHVITNSFCHTHELTDEPRIVPPNLVATTTIDGSLHIWDRLKDRPRSYSLGPGDPFRITLERVSADGAFVLIRRHIINTIADLDRLLLVDTATGKICINVLLGRYSAYITADNNYIIIAQRKGASIIDTHFGMVASGDCQGVLALLKSKISSLSPETHS